MMANTLINNSIRQRCTLKVTIPKNITMKSKLLHITVLIVAFASAYGKQLPEDRELDSPGFDVPLDPGIHRQLQLRGRRHQRGRKGRR